MNLTTKTDGELIAMIEAMQQVMANTDGNSGNHNTLPFHIAAALIEQAEDELAEREQARVLDEIHAEREAYEDYQAMLAAQLDDHTHSPADTRVSDDVPF